MSLPKLASNYYESVKEICNKWYSGTDLTKRDIYEYYRDKAIYNGFKSRSLDKEGKEKLSKRAIKKFTASFEVHKKLNEEPLIKILNEHLKQ